MVRELLRIIYNVIPSMRGLSQAMCFPRELAVADSLYLCLFMSGPTVRSTQNYTIAEYYVS